VWTGRDFDNDPELSTEVNMKRFTKSGEEIEMYDRAEARPEDNIGMFSFEAAGTGDQALAVKPFVG
jgi:hypothetical protein